MKLTIETPQIDNKELYKAVQKISLYKPIIEQHVSLQSAYSFLQIPFEQDYYQTINLLVEQKKLLNPTMIIVIGIGGSNLGCMAIAQVLLGDFVNESSPIKIYYADTVDAYYNAELLSFMEQTLKDGKEVLLNVISKSGKTIETIANYQLFLAMLKKYKKSYQQNVVVTTDEGSVLYEYAQRESLAILIIPASVGGRYSVFTAVGVFPLLLLGIDVEKIMQGAQQAVTDFFQQATEHNIGALRAALIYTMHERGIMIHDMFVFSKNLQMYNYWYRQLMAESIGKEYDLNDTKVEIGITPTVSVGSTDLHSVAQLYLSDTIRRFTTFVTVQQSDHELIIPFDEQVASIVPDLTGRTMTELMRIINMGVQKTYAQKGRPFCTIDLPVLDEYNVGYLMQLNMIEIVLLGFLLHIDPFNQPNVELYKIEVKKMLRQENG